MLSVKLSAKHLKCIILLLISLHSSVLEARIFTPSVRPTEGLPNPRGHRQCDVHAERGGVVRYFRPITSEHMAKPRPRPGSHMAGWSESSRAWLNMTGCGWQPGGHRVYWNSVTFVAEQPATVAQKENPGNTVDYLNLHHSPGLCKQLHSATVFPLWFYPLGVSTVWVSHSCLEINNFIILFVQLLFMTPH